MLPTIEELHTLLKLDVDGTLTWRIRPNARKEWNTRYAGKEAGGVSMFDNIPYRRLMVKGTELLSHRVVYAMHHGKWPEQQIDHIDGDGLNNTPSNLRDVSPKLNSRNTKMHSNNTSGVNGVSWCKRESAWRATIRQKGKKKSLGTRKNFFDAVCLRKSAENSCCIGYSVRHGT